MKLAKFVLTAAIAAAGSSAPAEPEQARHGSLYGLPGLIDMPTAEQQPDATLTGTVAHFGYTTRNTLSFQIMPRLSGSFRYSVLRDFSGPGRSLYDRSFDLRFLLVQEGRYRPAVAIGVQDVIGTGRFSAEYLVATKQLSPRFSATLGMGWGRLGSYGGFSNPLGALHSGFKTRPSTRTATGGQVNSKAWFRGDAALFGGLSWQATDKLSFVAEYSSDAYTIATARGLISRNTPVNLGFRYRFSPGVSVGAYYLYGSTLGANFTFALNPKHPPLAGSVDPAPPPIHPRPAAAKYAWPVASIQSATPGPGLHDRLREKLSPEGIELEGVELSRTAVRVRVRNQRYLSTAQAVGRTARILSQLMPAEVERFSIILSVQGMPSTAVTLSRTSLEDLDTAPDRAWQMYVRSRIEDPIDAGAPNVAATAFRPAFSWSLAPYLDTELFDPDDPLRADLGLSLDARYEPVAGVVFDGQLRKKLVGNLDTSTRPSDSVLPHVRSDNAIYNREGDPAIKRLTAATFFRPGRDLYGRVSAGYFEKMYGGLSAELLWKPNDVPFGLGVEVNYARQRDFDQLFGFQSYDIVTGHVSAYWEVLDGFQARVDTGRYLAGDWGATLSIDREFDNGWKVGAYATITDVSAAQFGEGSFDKGIKLTVPLSWFTGRSTLESPTATIRPVMRDGGARLEVPDRLYDLVRGTHGPALRKQRARFWR